MAGQVMIAERWRITIADEASRCRHGDPCTVSFVTNLAFERAVRIKCESLGTGRSVQGRTDVAPGGSPGWMQAHRPAMPGPLSGCVVAKKERRCVMSAGRAQTLSGRASVNGSRLERRASAVLVRYGRRVNDIGSESLARSGEPPEQDPIRRDEALMAQVAAGDETAFAAIAKAESPRLLRFTRSLLAPAEA